MARFTLSRRTILRGAAGVAVALPPLEIMTQGRSRAASSAIPSRYVQTYTGISLGADYSSLDDLALVVPGATGPGYVPTRALSPSTEPSFAGNVRGNVKADVGVVSGLKIPAGAPIPPAGRSSTAFFHVTTVRPQLAGERMEDKDSAGGQDPKGSTADQIVADALKGTTPFASIGLRVQASRYYGNQIGGAWTSYKGGHAIDPIISLREAYNVLFSAGGAVNGRTFDVASFIDRRKSILDTILRKSRRLQMRLGGEDRTRMDKYYTEIRALETSLTELKAKSGMMTCKPLAAPDDPPIGRDITPEQARDYANYQYAADNAWSNEELRAQVLCDFLHLALACDLTRAASLVFTVPLCGVSAFHVLATQRPCDMHGVCHGLHGSNMADVADVVGWHFKHFCRLTAKLRDTLEVDGSRLLDHAALSMVFEGGFGPDPLDGGRMTSHSSENMAVFVAGGAGGLKSGQHIHFNNDRHPGQVLLSHMNAVGVDGPLGEITQPLPELFRTA